MMAVLKDWKCPQHGTFESSHPICPNFDCDSKGVEQAFLKPPGYKSDWTKRFDQGIRRSADVYKVGDFKSARAGEAAIVRPPAQDKLVYWGDEASMPQAAGGLGMSMEQMVQGAQRPYVVNQLNENTGNYEQVRIPDGMRLASASGINSFGMNKGGSVIPKAEITGSKYEGELKIIEKK